MQNSFRNIFKWKYPLSNADAGIIFANSMHFAIRWLEREKNKPVSVQKKNRLTSHPILATISPMEHWHSIAAMTAVAVAAIKASENNRFNGWLLHVCWCATETVFVPQRWNVKKITTATLPESKSVQAFFGLNAFESKHFQINQLKNLAAHFGRTDFN